MTTMTLSLPWLMVRLPRAGPRTTKGFSLLETLFALALMSMSLVVLYQVLAGVIRSVGDTERHAHAIVLATSLLALHDTIPKGGVDTQGEHVVGGQALRWRLVASPTGALRASRPAAMSANLPPESSRPPDWPLYRTEVWVRWKTGVQEKEVHLVTIKLEQPLPIIDPG